MPLFLRLPNVCYKMKFVLFFAFAFGCFSYYSSAQTTFKFNALADAELSMAGKDSHYYYNEIHKDYTNIRFGVTQLNAIGQLNFKQQWSFNFRLLLERDKGQKLNKFLVPQLNIQWLSKDNKFGLTVGAFTNPFGSFNEKQLSTDRDFIGLPLAYAYYFNISDKIGYMEGMGDINKVPIDGEVQWGSTNLYYGGYTAGAMFSWNIKPSKINWKLALVSGASNLQQRFTDPLNFGVISRLKFQPAYFWEQGLSVSYGTFMQKSEVSDQLENLRTYNQTLIGTDFKLGTGFFEFSGEVIGAFYQVPQFNSENGIFDNNTRKISNLSAYLDIKYELPVLQGSYVAYRIDYLGFSKLDTDQSLNWDNKVQRHSVALGYNINRYLLVRVMVSTQQVDNKSWDKTQGTFRMAVTAYY